MSLVLVVVTVPALAVGPAPKELRGGKITVTTTDGKTYTFSSDEYAVVRRGSEDKVFTESDMKFLVEAHFAEGEENRDKAIGSNILSFGMIRSKNGFSTSVSPSTVDIESRYDLGIAVQYQRRFDVNNYVGGQLDSNGGAEVNFGVGF